MIGGHSGRPNDARRYSRRSQDLIDVYAADAREPVYENAVDMLDLFGRETARPGADSRRLGAPAHDEPVL